MKSNMIEVNGKKIYFKLYVDEDGDLCLDAIDEQNTHQYIATIFTGSGRMSIHRNIFTHVDGMGDE